MGNATNNHKGGNSQGSIGSIVNGTELANILGVSRNTIIAKAKKGMPIYDQNGLRGSNRFDTAACIKWFTAQEVGSRTTSEDDELDIDEIRRRRELALMKQEEINLAVTEERYAPIDEIIKEVSGALAEVRATLIALPAKAGELEHRDQLYIEDRLEKISTGALKELSDFDYDSEPEPE